MPLVGFEPMSSVGEQPQTYALDRAVTGTGNLIHVEKQKSTTMFNTYLPGTGSTTIMLDS